MCCPEPVLAKRSLFRREKWPKKRPVSLTCAVSSSVCSTTSNPMYCETSTGSSTTLPAESRNVCLCLSTFPDVCPEPVVANFWGFSINMAQKRRFRTSVQLRQRCPRAVHSRHQRAREVRGVGEAAAVDIPRVRDRELNRHLQKRLSLFFPKIPELFLCLSRACLGKSSVFSIKRRKQDVFTPRRAAGCAAACRPDAPTR
jgi:hypothetical protein